MILLHKMTAVGVTAVGVTAVGVTAVRKKTKVIRADLLDFAFDLYFYFEDSFRFGNISLLVTFQFK